MQFAYHGDKVHFYSDLIHGTIIIKILKIAYILVGLLKKAISFFFFFQHLIHLKKFLCSFLYLIFQCLIKAVLIISGPTFLSLVFFQCLLFLKKKKIKREKLSLCESLTRSGSLASHFSLLFLSAQGIPLISVENILVFYFIYFSKNLLSSIILVTIDIS